MHNSLAFNELRLFDLSTNPVGVEIGGQYPVDFDFQNPDSGRPFPSRVNSVGVWQTPKVTIYFADKRRTKNKKQKR